MATASFPIPNFSKTVSSGPGNEMMPAGSFLGGMSSTQNQYMNFPSMAGGGPSNTFDLSSYFPTAGPALTGGPFQTNSSGYPMPGYQMPGPAQNAPTTPPGIVPQAPSIAPPMGPRANPGDTASAGVGARLPGQAYQARTIDPQLTEQLAAFLMGQLGQGVTPFNLSALLPSTGQATAPGTLTAPENPLMQSLNQFYETGTGGPLPGVLPMWTSEMKAMEIPIQQQQANIEEAFGSRGALGSSEMASALETYGTQTARDQEALLGQLTLQALPGMESEAGMTQALDQQSIQNLYQEFLRTQPQNNPLMQDVFGMGTLFPAIYSNQKGPLATAFETALGTSLGSFGLSNPSGTMSLGAGGGG